MFGEETHWLLGIAGTVRSDVVAPIGIGLAVFVTIRVLLRKRDTRSAVGWIGLAWLSPILGSILYFSFGVNRVERRARRLRRHMPRGRRRTAGPARLIPHSLAPLECAARRITNRTAEAGNAVTLYNDGDEGYPAMIAAIEAAQASVALSSYIMFDDEAGARFADALAAAMRRGVAVRVLVDGIGSGYFRSPIYHRLRSLGVPVGRFMHSSLPWRMPFLNLRSHKKILVVDGRIGFTGGLNIAAQNLVAAQPPNAVRDTHFRFEGPVVAQLMEAFASDWMFVTDEDLDGPLWFPPLSDAGEAVARVVTSGPDEDLEKIEFLILAALSCARHSVAVMTPYFLPHERLMTSIALAAIRGVDVDIVVPEVSDHRMIDWALHAHVGPLLREGVRIWLNPPPFEHSKILVVDNEWCLIGSSNWDMRSLRLNFELNVETYHTDLASKLARIVEDRKTRRLMPEDLTVRSLPVRLRDAAVRLLLPYL